MTIILDTSNKPFYNNEIFKFEIALKYPGSLTAFYLCELCKKNNVEIFTADYVIANNVDVKDAFIITEILTPWTKELIKRGAKRHILLCMETPSFAWKFYARLKKISSHYKYSFLFSGSKLKVSEQTIFIPIIFPQPDFNSNIFLSNSWENRSHLTLINSNQIRRVYKPLHIFYSLFDKSLRSELYTLRLKLIYFFHKSGKFDLYGRNWEKKIFGISKKYHKAALSVYKGSVEDKIATMSNYKFALCIENIVYPGYITEKIFDCLFAGCIPIYYGAPDVQDYIPENCYIDYRKFNNNNDLEIYLNNFDNIKFKNFNSNISNFLQSAKFKEYTCKSYAEKLFSTITKNQINYV
jgi:hypothetical protein